MTLRPRRLQHTVCTLHVLAENNLTGLPTHLHQVIDRAADPTLRRVHIALHVEEGSYCSSYREGVTLLLISRRGHLAPHIEEGSSYFSRRGGVILLPISRRGHLAPHIEEGSPCSPYRGGVILLLISRRGHLAFHVEEGSTYVECPRWNRHPSTT